MFNELGGAKTRRYIPGTLILSVYATSAFNTRLRRGLGKATYILLELFRARLERYPCRESLYVLIWGYQQL